MEQRASKQSPNEELIAASVAATLDFVLATWAKVTWIAGTRLNGRVFGQSTQF